MSILPHVLKTTRRLTGYRPEAPRDTPDWRALPALEDTPAAFLLRDDFSFLNGELTVTGFERRANTMRISVVQTKDPLAGELTLVFMENPMVLRKWVIKDAQGVVTELTLVNARFDFPIPEQRFLERIPNFVTDGN